MPKINRQQYYVLVRHTGFSEGGDIRFKNAVEARSISLSKEELEQLVAAKGMIFSDYLLANKAEETENYPPDVKGLIPEAKGIFVKVPRIQSLKE